MKIVRIMFSLSIISIILSVPDNTPKVINNAQPAAVPPKTSNLKQVPPPKPASRKESTYFLQVTNKVKSNANELFRDVVASEDRYDPSSHRQQESIDYNNLEEVDEHELENIIKDDLTGEEVKYQFD